MSTPTSVGILSLLLVNVAGNVYDVLMPAYKVNATTCPGGCAAWTNLSSNTTEQAFYDAMWYDGKPPANASNVCAMPAASSGMFECDGCTVDRIWNSFGGPWCYCSSPVGAPAGPVYCEPSATAPEQINLQIARADVVVASFVSHDVSFDAAKAPIAEFAKVGETPKTIGGVAHLYEKLTEAEGMNYVLNFIKMGDLEPATEYTYRVQSGQDGAGWSDWFTFRSMATSGPTRLGIYGDMGHSRFNNMQNLQQDCAAGAVDFIVHMGDHAYNMKDAGDRRGDAYMNAWQPTLSQCPWLPVIGNHESNDGDNFNRYLNMSWGETLGDIASLRSTATSVLGDLLTKATLLGPGFHSRVPSNTSRYFSVDIGLVHIAGLDLNNLDAVQLRWLDEDLYSVDREKQPWIIVTSHFPLHHATVAAHADASAAYYRGEASERYAYSGHEFVQASCEVNSKGERVCEETVGQMMADVSTALEPLLYKHGVDIYDAGHVHDYNSNWPICYNNETKSSNICRYSDDHNIIDNFHRPRGTVHITEGNGGVPGVVGKWDINANCSSKDALWCRSHGDGGAYGRIIIYNTTTLEYQHVQNNGSVVSDSFVIYQPEHKPYFRHD